MALSTSSQGIYAHEPRISVPGILVIAGLHVAAFALLASQDAVKLPPQTMPLMVHVIPPEPPRIQEAAPPVPRPVARQPVPQPRQQPALQPQVLAAETSAPSAASEVPVAKAPPAPAPVSASPLATEPRFDADYLDNPAPVYPAMSRRLEESGKVVLRVYVESSGRPSQIQVKASSGSPRLDQAAQDAVWRWKFVPARRGDEAIGAWVLVPIEFNLGA